MEPRNRACRRERRPGRNSRTQHEQCRQVRGIASVPAPGVGEHVTRTRNAPEAGRSRHVWPKATIRSGPHREGEEPKPMMHDRGKSDSAIVAVKPTNNAGQPAAEPVEPRAGTKGNADQQSTRRAQDRVSVSVKRWNAYDRPHEGKGRRSGSPRSSTISVSNCYGWPVVKLELKKDAAAGVDGLTWRDYGADLERNLEGLHGRVQRGSMPSAWLPSRCDRTYRSRTDDSQRPIAIAALEDKIVQRATAAVLKRDLRRATSSGSRMGSGPSAASMTRWWSGSAARR